MVRSKRKQEILAAALSCFNEFGIEGTTIDQIRERSGASVGSLYHHFGSKEKIAATLFLDGMEDHHRRLTAALEQAEDAEAGVKAIVRSYMTWVASNPELARFVLNTRAQIANSAGGEALVESNRRHLAELKRYLEQWIENGAIRLLPKASYSAIIIGPAHDYARGWLSGRNKTPIQDLIDVFEEAAWRALKAD
jgi:AcrR family transcriptional regulator